jgi:hypothetical protein
MDLCAAENIVIEEMVCIASGTFDRILNRCGFCNAGSSRILARITKSERSANIKRSCVCQKG